MKGVLDIIRGIALDGDQRAAEKGAKLDLLLLALSRIRHVLEELERCGEMIDRFGLRRAAGGLNTASMR